MFNKKERQTSFFQNIKKIFNNTFSITGSKKKYEDELNLTFTEIVNAKGYFIPKEVTLSKNIKL